MKSKNIVNITFKLQQSILVHSQPVVRFQMPAVLLLLNILNLRSVKVDHAFL